MTTTTDVQTDCFTLCASAQGNNNQISFCSNQISLLKFKNTQHKISSIFKFPKKKINSYVFHRLISNREKILNDVILVGSCNDARSLAAVVGRCPALGVTVKALLGEFPQVLFFDWHWRTTRHMENMCFLINPHSRTEELT